MRRRRKIRRREIIILTAFIVKLRTVPFSNMDVAAFFLLIPGNWKNLETFF
jgi:hypothetical protein